MDTSTICSYVTDKEPTLNMEQQPDQTKTEAQPSALSRTWNHLSENVRPSGLAEFELLILTFCIGLQGTPTPNNYPTPPLPPTH